MITGKRNFAVQRLERILMCGKVERALLQFADPLSRHIK